ncbi:MAG: arginine--tRNA ligase [Ruminococcaceae bacterium]|nr:arginine--tRNA ligase [Oscillospiraceae bacterium]
MSQIVKLVKEQLYSLIQKTLPKEHMEYKIEVPADRSNGDFSTNVAMVNSKIFSKAPRMVAEEILEQLDLAETYFDKVEVAGPGFMNFYLKDEFYADILIDILNSGGNYGKSDFGEGKKVLVEFVSANPTGPMHMGNARGGALGDCLATILEWAGYYVEREFYINDAGNQIDKFGLSLDIRYQQYFKGEKIVELPEDSYHGDDIILLAKEFAEINGDRYLNESEEVRRAALVEFALPKNIEDMKAILAKYRIEYDTWFKESSLYETEVKDTIDELTKRGYTYESEDALWYKNIKVQTEILKAEGKSNEDIEKLELKDDVLVRANGNPTYFVADIAYHRNKIKRGFDKSINIWGADHHGHVARMQGALYALGFGAEKLDVLLMQLVRLVKDGEVVRMSKRTGKAIMLKDLLEEIPIDAVRFLFNMREAGSQMDFDLDLAVEQSSQNPVYYCQYAHARICSILRKLEEDRIEIIPANKEDLMLLKSFEERELIRHLSALTDEIVQAAKNYEPARMTRYCIELATLFHKFYNACYVNVENEALRRARIHLCLCVKNVISNVLSMMKITVPEQM